MKKSELLLIVSFVFLYILSIVCFAVDETILGITACVVCITGIQLAIYVEKVMNEHN